MDDDLQQAITLIKSGDKKNGGQLLAKIVKKDPRNVTAWLWLSSCVNSKEQRIFCLKRVLEVEPEHKTALSALSKLQQPELPVEKDIIREPNNSQEPENKQQHYDSIRTGKKTPSDETSRKVRRFIKEALADLTYKEKKILLTLVGVFIFLVFYGGSILITDSTVKPSAIVYSLPTHKPLPKIIPTKTFTLTPTKIPLKTSTNGASIDVPLSTPTTANITTPTARHFFPSLPSVEINSQNYPEIYDPQSYIQNPEKYRDSRFSITLYVSDLVNVQINGKRQSIVSLNTQRGNSGSLPVVVFGLTSLYSYINLFEIGDMVTIYGIGMGSVDGQTLDNLFGKYTLLPYTPNRNWSVSCILGEASFVH